MTNGVGSGNDCCFEEGAPRRLQTLPLDSASVRRGEKDAKRMEQQKTHSTGHHDPPRAPLVPPPPAPPHKALPQSRGLARGASSGAGTAIPPLSLLAERHQPAVPAASSGRAALSRLSLQARPRPPPPAAVPTVAAGCLCAPRPSGGGEGASGAGGGGGGSGSLSHGVRQPQLSPPLLPAAATSCAEMVQFLPGRWGQESRAAGRGGGRSGQSEGLAVRQLPTLSPGAGDPAPPPPHAARAPRTRPQEGAAAPTPWRPMELMGERRRQREGSIKEVLLNAGNRCVMLGRSEGGESLRLPKPCHRNRVWSSPLKISSPCVDPRCRFCIRQRCWRAAVRVQSGSWE
ncbi:forkhead box protein D2-like [Coturnix japonica]|uniref:forkhead box protein D2-like n=1 Tax=Coturnix japonica TaxID=93934 RepID=UPI0013A5C200|nr:forkhead box protein D2-like [Coturnix japonica]